MPTKMSVKTVRTLVRLMRAQKVQSFSVGEVSVQFAPEAYLPEPVVAPPPPPPHDGDDPETEFQREA